MSDWLIPGKQGEIPELGTGQYLGWISRSDLARILEIDQDKISLAGLKLAPAQQARLDAWWQEHP